MNICCQVSTPEVFRIPGVTSYQDDLEQAARRLIGWGYEGIELTVRNPRELDTISIEKMFTKLDIPVPMICTGEIYGQDKLSFADRDEQLRREAVSRFKDAADLAARFGAYVNLGRIRGGLVPGEHKQLTLSRIFDALQEVTQYAEQQNVVIALEPVNTLALNYINTTLEGLELVQRINSSSFQLMIDTAHLHIEDRDIEAAVTASKDHIIYVHLADSNRRYLGAGKFDFPKFLELLNSIGYDRWLGVEVFPMEDQDESFRRSLEYIIPCIR